MFVDAHLDIAWNALCEGRHFERPAPEQYLVSREGLADAGVGLVFPTLFTLPHGRGGAGNPGDFAYRTPREAHLSARAQLGYYRALGIELLRSRQEVKAYRRAWRPGRLAGVLLMENADPIESPAQVGKWAELGLRIVGMAWSRTRYCGGTRAPGGITEAGRGLLRAMHRHGLTLDISHMADRSIRDSFELWHGPLIATHGGARTLNPGQRQLPDWAIKEVGARGGVMGISFYSGHLRQQGRGGVNDVVRTAVHFATVSGSPSHVGIGSDLDGGFDRTHAVVDSLQQMAQVAEALCAEFSATEVAGILGANWLRFLEESLPA